MASTTSNRTKALSSSNEPTGPSPDAANISIREYIYFTPHPLPPNTPIPYSIGLPHNNPLNLPKICFEPTSTLVLTTPNHTFVDIRLYKPLHISCPDTLPNKSEPGRLEWAFAGISSSTPIRKQGWEGKSTSHSTWTHWVDSRYPVNLAEAIPVDEGEMYPINDTLTLEVGHAFHPALGRVSGHEEMWRDVGIGAVRDLTPIAASVTTTTTTTAAAAAKTNQEEKKIAITLRFEDANADIRGVVVRVGQYCQGLLMKGSEVTVERWEFVGGGGHVSKEGKKEENLQSGVGNKQSKKEEGEEAEQEEEVVDGWKRTARIGGLYLPCSATFRPRVLSLGGVVRYYEFEWDVEEVWEW